MLFNCLFLFYSPPTFHLLIYLYISAYLNVLLPSESLLSSLPVFMPREFYPLNVMKFLWLWMLPESIQMPWETKTQYRAGFAFNIASSNSTLFPLSSLPALSQPSHLFFQLPETLSLSIYLSLFSLSRSLCPFKPLFYCLSLLIPRHNFIVFCITKYFDSDLFQFKIFLFFLKTIFP